LEKQVARDLSLTSRSQLRVDVEDQIIKFEFVLPLNEQLRRLWRYKGECGGARSQNGDRQYCDGEVCTSNDPPGQGKASRYRCEAEKERRLSP